MTLILGLRLAAVSRQLSGMNLAKWMGVTSNSGCLPRGISSFPSHWASLCCDLASVPVAPREERWQHMSCVTQRWVELKYREIFAESERESREDGEESRVSDWIPSDSNDILRFSSALASALLCLPPPGSSAVDANVLQSVGEMKRLSHVVALHYLIPSARLGEEKRWAATRSSTSPHNLSLPSFSSGVKSTSHPIRLPSLGAVQHTELLVRCIDTSIQLHSEKLFLCHQLYRALEDALALCEYLSHEGLAAMARCFALCAECSSISTSSCALTLLKSKSEPRTGDVRLALQHAEQVERNVLREQKLTTSVKSSSLMSDLATAVAETQGRLQAAVRSFDVSDRAIQLSRGAKALQAKWDSNACNASRAAEGKLALQSFQSLRSIASDGSHKDINRKRKTIADYQPTSPSMLPFPADSLASTAAAAACRSSDPIPLTNVADICESVASLRYVDQEFWDSVVIYVCGEAVRASKAKDSALEGFFGSVRRVCFSLHYAQQVDGYECVMNCLVQRNLLREPVPAPR